MNAGGIRLIARLLVVSCVLLLGPSRAWAQERVVGGNAAVAGWCNDFGASSSPLRALVIGNASYSSVLGTLQNPTLDADRVSLALSADGFGGTVCKNLPTAVMNRVFALFEMSLHANEVALFYYSGHGSAIGSDNSLYGTDYDCQQVTKTVRLSTLVDDLNQRDGSDSLNILLIDACRSTANGVKSAQAEWFLPVGYAEGLYVAFSTAPYTTASDGLAGSGSPFAIAFASAITSSSGVELDMAVRATRKDVLLATSNRQRVWVTHSIVGSFSFKTAAAL